MNTTKLSRLAFVAAVTLCAAAGANATIFGDSPRDTYNQPTATGGNAAAGAAALGVGVGIGQGGAGGQGGEGGRGGQGGAGGSVLGSGNSTSTSIQGQQQGQGQAQGQGQRQQATGGASSAQGGTSSAIGGTSSAAGGNGAGNATTVSVAGATYEAASSTAYAPDGKAPRTSCRIFIGLGGSGRDGSLSGGIPVGNDQTCMSGAQIEAMDKANKVLPGSFLIGDYLLAICKMEGMDATAGCKAK